MFQYNVYKLDAENWEFGIRINKDFSNNNDYDTWFKMRNGLILGQSLLGDLGQVCFTRVLVYSSS